MPINIIGVKGAASAPDPHQLSPNIGEFAQDMEPGRDRFVPLRHRVTRATVPSSPQRNSLYRMGRDVLDTGLYWLSNQNFVTYARIFGNDPTELTLIAGDGTPKWTNTAIGLGSAPYPQALRELSVPAPTNAPSVSLTTNGSGTEGERFYVQTFVNDRGWESAPSPPSNALTCKIGSIVAISGLGAPPAGNYGLTGRRIYVTQPGEGEDSDYFFLKEIAVASTTTTDNAESRGALLATYDGTVGSSWLPPPVNGHSIIAMWNGMHGMLSDKYLFLCEPDAPYAWPFKYQKSLRSAGVALGKWAQNLVVLTTAEAIIYQGLDPLTLAPLPSSIDSPCLSAAGVVSMGDGVAWPSNEGIAWVGDSGYRNLTQFIFTSDQWQAMDPTSIVAARWGSYYVASFTDVVGRRGFILDPADPTFVIWLSSGFDAAHYDEISQALYVLVGGNVQEFGAGELMDTSVFISKRFLSPAPVNYGHIKVTARGYPVGVQIIARWHDPYDGTVRLNNEVKTITGPNAFTLQSGFLADSYQVSFAGPNEVLAVRLAIDPRDLKGQ